MVCTPPYATRTAIRTVEYGLTVSVTPNVVVVVCVWPPKVDKQCPAIPGVWGHTIAPNAPWRP
eukprot:6616277-Prymnesium_polylepis.1